MHSNCGKSANNLRTEQGITSVSLFTVVGTVRYTWGYLQSLTHSIRLVSTEFSTHIMPPLPLCEQTIYPVSTAPITKTTNVKRRNS